MTLKIGDTIRRLRRRRNLTQEQLAVLLGVSSQAVSRWENGSTYPDIEILPAMTKAFGVTADELLGLPVPRRNPEELKLHKCLEEATFQRPFDPEKVNALIREIRRDWLDGSYLGRFWIYPDIECLSSPEILPEVRLLAEAQLERTKDADSRNIIIGRMAVLESEEDLEDFLQKYSAWQDISKETLRRSRYRQRKDWKKYELLRQRYLLGMIDTLLADPWVWRSPEEPMDAETALQLSFLRLDLLRRLCGDIPDERRPISGNGELDCFAFLRIRIGIAYSCCLSGCGRIEEALLALEDTVALLEKVMEIEEYRTLQGHSPWIDERYELGALHHFHYKNDGLPKEKFIRFIHQDSFFYTTYDNIFPSEIARNMENLENTEEWAGFDQLREEPRFFACLSRVKALIIPEEDAKMP